MPLIRPSTRELRESVHLLGPVTSKDFYVNEQALATALAFAEWGFPIVSVWRPDTGVCRCSKGKDCRTPGKHPIPRDGFKAATTDEARIRTMLGAAGSDGQYGLRAAPHTILIDADGPGFADRVKELGLTDTLIVRSGSGLHLYFYWPESYGPVPTHLFGWKVRSETHEGIVIGPGSTHANGKLYRMYRQNGHDAHEMLATIRNFPEALVPQLAQATRPELTLVVTEGSKQPEDIGEGGRHDYLRNKGRYYFGLGLRGAELFAVVDSFNQRFPVPKSREDVERAIDEPGLLAKYQTDAPRVTPTVIVTPASADGSFLDLIQNIVDYRAAQPQDIEWCSPLVAFGFTSVLAGPPKAGKSTLIAGLLKAREKSMVYLWGDMVPAGDTLLVTEEGGFPVVRKTEGLTQLNILDRAAFVRSGRRDLQSLIDGLLAWAEQATKPLIVVDTFAIWGDIENENDASQMTRQLEPFNLLAQMTGAAIPLIHHTRKGGGEAGEGVRGSSAFIGSIAQVLELSYTNAGQLNDQRVLTMSGRLDFASQHTLDFDRDELMYTLGNASIPADPYGIADVPMVGGTETGFDAKELGQTWGMGPSGAKRRAGELVAKGVLVEGTKPVGRARAKVWLRALPRLDLDTRSKGEQMADIFKDDAP